jgi:hypothetical protein
MIAVTAGGLVGYGRLSQRVSGNESVNKEIKERLKSGDDKMEDLVVSIAEIKRDIKWIREKNGG